MPIPSILFVQILQLIVKTSLKAFKGSTIVEKVTKTKIAGHEIEITRRSTLGVDEGISQVVRIFKNRKLEEAWHIVVRAGKIIHQHLLK